MSAALFLMVAVSLMIAARGLLARDRAFEFPTAAALLYLAFLVPQALAIERDGLGARYDGATAWIYMTACLVAIAAGFRLGKGAALRRAARLPPRPLNEPVLMLGAAALLVLGLEASRRVGHLSGLLDTGSQWTGVITLYYLLIQASFFALALAALRYLGTGRLVYLLVAAVALVAVLALFGQYAKRHMIAEAAIILAGAWFFLRHRQPPRAVLVAAALLGTVLLHQVGAIRAYVNAGEGNAYQAIAEGVPFRQFAYFEMERAPELTQAVADIYAANLTGTLEGPAELWNRLVQQYVPAFLVGREAKEALKLGTNRGVEALELGHLSSFGATRTGFSDTYRAYSVFGCLVFLALGAFMGQLYGHALGGRLWAQFCYLVLLNDALVAITESTVRFLATLPFVLALTLPVFLLAGLPRRLRPAPPPVGRARWRAGAHPRGAARGAT